LTEERKAVWKEHAIIAIAVIAVLAGYSTIKGSEYSGKASSELSLSQQWLTDYESAANYAALWATWATYYDSLSQNYDRLGDKTSSAFYQGLYLQTLSQYETESQRAVENYEKYTSTYAQSNRDSAIADSFTLPTMMLSVSAVVCASSDVTDERWMYVLGLVIAAIGGGLLVWNIVLIGAIDGCVLIPLLAAVLGYAWWRIKGRATKQT